MKVINIDGFVALWYDETGVSYAQIMNCISNCSTQEELVENMRVALNDTQAGKHFVWGYRDNLFWLRQRNGYESNELLLDFELTVKFV